MNKADIFWQTYLNLENQAIELSKYIFFTDEKLLIDNSGEKHESCNTQLETFSPYISDLLVSSCIQVEAISKELYFDNGGLKTRSDSNNVYFDTDCLKFFDEKWSTSKKIVLIVAPFFNFTKDENKILKPLKEAHKPQGTYWEKAYQAVKHDRYHNLFRGNIKSFLHALAALYLLNLYYRNNSWTISYNELSNFDFSGGSKIFAVKPPDVDQLWYDNIPLKSDSPYLIKYTDQAYKEIQNMQQEEYNNCIKYLNAQPEYKEPAFQNLLKTEKNPKLFSVFKKLCEYRLNKKIPKTLPFETRKKRLIHCSEWNSQRHQKCKHLSESEITEENIQQEIYNVAGDMCIEILSTYQKLAWVPKATNSKSCRIYIPDINDQMN